jgi:hypothetical protein
MFILKYLSKILFPIHITSLKLMKRKFLCGIILCSISFKLVIQYNFDNTVSFNLFRTKLRILRSSYYRNPCGMLWPALWLDHRATPSTISLHRSWCSFDLCVHDLFSLSLSLLFVIRPGDRTLYIAECCVVIGSGVWFCGYTQWSDNR